MDILELTFCKNFKNWLDAQPRKTITKLSKGLKISPGYISNLAAGRRAGSESIRRKIAQKIGMDYDEMINVKKTGDKKPDDTPPAPIPMDPAIEILHEALEETGVTINERQKHAVLKILREELAKLNSKTKEDIKKYLAVFGK